MSGRVACLCWGGEAGNPLGVWLGAEALPGCCGERRTRCQPVAGFGPRTLRPESEAPTQSGSCGTGPEAPSQGARGTGSEASCPGGTCGAGPGALCSGGTCGTGCEASSPSGGRGTRPGLTASLNEPAAQNPRSRTRDTSPAEVGPGDTASGMSRSETPALEIDGSETSAPETRGLLPEERAKRRILRFRTRDTELGCSEPGHAKSGHAKPGCTERDTPSPDTRKAR